MGKKITTLLFLTLLSSYSFSRGESSNYDPESNISYKIQVSNVEKNPVLKKSKSKISVIDSSAIAASNSVNLVTIQVPFHHNHR